ncbi:hypothetical protein LTR94_012347 [Friedmanniomyces endolithicus]|nr:hypothetical protein LTR94_012347 [Friedmanniomyces endolithicus]
MAQEMHDLIGDGAGVDHRGVGDGQGDMVAFARTMGGGDADLAVIGRAEDAAGEEPVHRPVARDDAERIVDLAQRRQRGRIAARAQQRAGLVQDQRIEAQAVEKVGNLAAAIGRAEHDDAAEMIGAMAGEPRTQHEAAHRMADAMDGRGGIGRAGDDAGVEMIDDAGQRPAPAGIADIGDVIPRPAQPPGKQHGKGMWV